MNDIIYRSSAITLPVMPKEYRKYQTQNIDDAYDQGWYDLQKCIEQLPSAQPQPQPQPQPEPQWILCSERLPEDKYVLISKKPTKLSGSKWCVTIAIRMADPRSRKVNWRDIGFNVIQDNEVLAWMPLPEPYEESGRKE